MSIAAKLVLLIAVFVGGMMAGKLAGGSASSH